MRLIWRIPSIIAHPWLNVLVFQLANQRLSEKEDALNKPWRPIPSGRLTSDQVRHLLMLAIPTVLICTYLLGAWQETALLFVLTWLYNDLGGGDENFVIRNLVIATAFGLYNCSTFQIACGTDCEISPDGWRWTTIISGVIFCTMQVQDLHDQAGDRVRARRTAPLAIGDYITRWTVALPILGFSILCPLYVGLPKVALTLPLSLGLLITVRLFMLREPKHDKRTWLIWAGWLITLYFLPLMKSLERMR